MEKSIFQTADENRIFTEGYSKNEEIAQLPIDLRYEAPKITSNNMSLIVEEEKSSETKTKNSSDKSNNINY